MPSIKRIASSLNSATKVAKAVNWHPGHMFSGMQAMIGKLNTVDCVIEVHDARIPTIGRNREFRQHLGAVKPHILVLNKSDLADLTRWNEVKDQLAKHGDKNVILSDLSGSQFSDRGYTKLMEKVFDLIRNSDRNNRAHLQNFKVMIVGIPNVGKSTLINRLRQYHLGYGGDATRTGNSPGVTRHVENLVKICAKPLIYSMDTPGVLQPSATRNYDNAMKLALCSTISDRALDTYALASYLLGYLNSEFNFHYTHSFNLDEPEPTIEEFCKAVAEKNYPMYQIKTRTKIESLVDTDKICHQLVNLFRKGMFGKVMFF